MPSYMETYKKQWFLDPIKSSRFLIILTNWIHILFHIFVQYSFLVKIKFEKTLVGNKILFSFRDLQHTSATTFFISLLYQILSTHRNHKNLVQTNLEWPKVTQKHKSWPEGHRGAKSGQREAQSGPNVG